VAKYIAELQALSQYCNFKDTLELMLGDRIVCGINDAQIQKRLLAEKSLMYSKAREIALSLKFAVQGTKDIQCPSNNAVHKMTVRKQNCSSKCFHCDRTKHKAPQCQFKDAVCKKCNKIGHLAKFCQSKKDSSSAKASKKPLSTHAIF